MAMLAVFHPVRIQRAREGHAGSASFHQLECAEARGRGPLSRHGSQLLHKCLSVLKVSLSSQNLMSRGCSRVKLGSFEHALTAVIMLPFLLCRLG